MTDETSSRPTIVTDEVVERVARALCEYAIRKYANKPTGFIERVNAEVDKSWREYEEQARAAIAAMPAIDQRLGDHALPPSGLSQSSLSQAKPAAAIAGKRP